MPKEMIKAESFDVEVSWGREMQCVSVATVMPDQRTADEPADLLELVNAAPDGWKDARGLYASIESRSGVNKLIRDLRRARDQAFGRDE
jgi:hypothetical protein